MKILVTGVLGFIGSHFAKMMLDRGHTVMGLNRATNSINKKRLSNDVWALMNGAQYNEDYFTHPNFTYIERDTAKDDLSGLAEEADVIINFAAKTFVDHSIRDPAPFVEANLVGTYRLLEEARKAPNLKKFIQVSTDEVYGSILKGAYKEGDGLNPTNPYAATKAAADMLCVSYFNTYKMPIIITRTENNYGAYQHPQKVFPKFVKFLQEGKKLPVYGDGKHRRMWLHVTDHCEAIALLIEKGVNGEIYHVAGEQELENIELAHKLIELSGFPKGVDGYMSWIEFIEDHNVRPGHDRRYALNCDKIRKLGWKPLIDLDEGIKQTAEWYRDNEWWFNQ